MNYVFRCYVEKKPGFNLEARQLFRALRRGCGVTSLANLRIFDRFDADGLDFPVYLAAKTGVFSDPAQDDLYEEALPPQDPDTRLLVVEPIPGGPEGRSAAGLNALRALTMGAPCALACARVYALTGKLSDGEWETARALLIPPGYQEGSLDKPASLPLREEVPPVPPSSPAGELAVSVDTGRGREDWALSLRTAECADAFQTLRVFGRGSPDARDLPAWGRGTPQFYFHPSYEGAPVDGALSVTARPGAAGKNLPLTRPRDIPLVSLEGCPGAAEGETSIQRVEAILHDLTLASHRGLAEGWDGGEECALMPFGGKNQRTPAQVSAALLPTDGETCSVLACSLHPELAGGQALSACAVECAARLVAAGCDPEEIGLLPMEGGGMYGAAPAPLSRLRSPEFKAIRHPVYLFAPQEEGWDGLTAMWREFHTQVQSGNVLAAWAVGRGGALEGLMKMALGSEIGFVLSGGADLLPAPAYGAIAAECAQAVDTPCASLLGRTAYTPMLELDDCFLSLRDLEGIWESTLEDLHPTRADTGEKDSDMVDIFCAERPAIVAAQSFARPRALIPLLPGSRGAGWARACRRAGVEPEFLPLAGFSPEKLAHWLEDFSRAAARSQMVILPGGRPAPWTPGGPGSLLALLLSRPQAAQAIDELLKVRDGLLLGVGEGFQALVRAGLLPFGEFRQSDGQSPAFTLNLIGRPQCRYVTTRVASLKSPWMLACQLDEIYTLPVCHGQGRLTVSRALLADLIAGGQVATQYVDTAGIPSLDITVNPSGAVESVEGLFSPDGRVFGRMAHFEAWDALARNIPGAKYQPILEGAGLYYR